MRCRGNKSQIITPDWEPLLNASLLPRTETANIYNRLKDVMTAKLTGVAETYADRRMINTHTQWDTKAQQTQVMGVTYKVTLTDRAALFCLYCPNVQSEQRLFFLNKIHTSLHSLSPRPSLFISLPSPALITLLLGASNQNGRRRSLRGRSFHSAIAVVMPEETEREEGDGVGGTGWEGGGRA